MDDRCSPDCVCRGGERRILCTDVSGTHWFSDAVGGAILAALVLALARRADDLLRRDDGAAYVISPRDVGTRGTVADAYMERASSRLP